MSKIIYKYPIKEKLSFDLNLPVGSVFLKCALQNSQPVMWFQQPTGETKKEKRTFSIIGTGWATSSDEKYLGTYIDGDLVWHLHEVLN